MSHSHPPAEHSVRSCWWRRRMARPQYSGLSLLEVMLALAILGGALAVIGELTRLGARSAETARDLTRAQRYCENKMAEVSAGLVTPQAITWHRWRNWRVNRRRWIGLTRSKSNNCRKPA